MYCSRGKNVEDSAFWVFIASHWKLLWNGLECFPSLCFCLLSGEVGRAPRACVEHWTSAAWRRKVCLRGPLAAAEAFKSLICHNLWLGMQVELKDDLRPTRMSRTSTRPMPLGHSEAHLAPRPPSRPPLQQAAIRSRPPCPLRLRGDLEESRWRAWSKRSKTCAPC